MTWNAVGLFLKLWGGYILAGILVGGMFWFYDSWEDRGKKIKDQAEVIKSKDNVIELLRAKEKKRRKSTMTKTVDSPNWTRMFRTAACLCLLLFALLLTACTDRGLGWPTYPKSTSPVEHGQQSQPPIPTTRPGNTSSRVTPLGSPVLPL